MPPQDLALLNNILSTLPPADKPFGFNKDAFFRDFSEIPKKHTY